MRILVTGATGNVGRLVVDHLLAAGASVRALTNNPAKAALPPEVEVVEGYLGRLDTVPGAVAGVERMYLAPLPATVEDVVPIAVAAGVRRIVDLSATSAADEAVGDPGGWHFFRVERAVEQADVEWTHLRAGEFMINMLAWAEMVRRDRVVRAPYGQAAMAPVDLDDVARVAATVLLEDGHHGKRYVLTGAEAVRRTEMARLIGVAIGRDVRFEEQSRDEAVEALQPAMGEWAAWFVDGIGEAVDLPHPGSRTIEELTGLPATSFAEWAAKHADEFR